MHSAQRLPEFNSSEGRHLGHLSIDTLAAGLVAALLAVPSGLSINISVGGILALILTPVTCPDAVA